MTKWIKLECGNWSKRRLWICIWGRGFKMKIWVWSVIWKRKIEMVCEYEETKDW